MTADDLLDAFGVAELLGVSKNTAYRLIRRGTLPASGRWPRLVRRADVEYLRRCRIRPGELRPLDQYPCPLHPQSMSRPSRSTADQ